MTENNETSFNPNDIPPAEVHVTNSHSKPTAPQIIEAVCAVFLVFITMAYTIYASQQAAASQKSAAAAKSAASVANSTLVLAERAWLGARLENTVYELNKPLLAIVAFENLGKTPAVNVRTCQMTKLVIPGNSIDVNCPDTALSPGLDVIQPTGKNERIGNAVGFDNEPHLNSDGLLTKPVTDTLLHGQKVALTYGYVKYDDIFGGQHWTKYCYQLKVLVGSPGMPETHIWGNCEVGNDVDRNYDTSPAQAK